MAAQGVSLLIVDVKYIWYLAGSIRNSQVGLWAC